MGQTVSIFILTLLLSCRYTRTCQYPNQPCENAIPALAKNTAGGQREVSQIQLATSLGLNTIQVRWSIYQWINDTGSCIRRVTCSMDVDGCLSLKFTCNRTRQELTYSALCTLLKGERKRVCVCEYVSETEGNRETDRQRERSQREGGRERERVSKVQQNACLWCQRGIHVFLCLALSLQQYPFLPQQHY